MGCTLKKFSMTSSTIAPMIPNKEKELAFHTMI